MTLDSIVQSFAPARLSLPPAPKTAAIAALSFAWAFAAHDVQAQNANSAPRLPEMSSYNCAALDAGASTRHIGQVIKGRYYEWHEIYVPVDGQQRLACISLLRPDTKQLAGDEAKTFLTNAFAIGAPAATTNETNATQSIAPDVQEPANVQPEPLKRPGKRPASESGAEVKSSITDLPPVPATKNFGDPAQSSPVAPPKERSSAIAPEAAPEMAYEKPLAVGVDDRVKISNTQIFPWTTVGYLSVTYPDGGSFRCSATLVSPYVVLTAGHCIHNLERGGYVTSARVYPGQTQANLGDGIPIRPYGVNSDVQAVQTTAQWTQISGKESYPIDDYRHDFAAIQFKTPFTHTSTFMPVLYGNTLSPITEAGYPAEINNSNAFGLYVDDGTETSQSVNSLRQVHVREFRIDATGGNSGGPLFYVDGGTNQRYLVGSLSYGEDLDDQGGGPWYDSWNQSLVSGWVSWTPGTAAAGNVNGLRVSSVFSSLHTNVTSYLRFYNAGNTAGTVEVTLSDYTTGNVLGTWTSPSIAGHRTRQFGIWQLEDDANADFTKPAIYALSIRPTFTGNFQSNLWNTGSLSLSNTSTCDTPSTNQKTLIYVHSSLLAPYTSVVVLHNTGTVAATPRLTIYNGETGALITTYTTNVIPANGQLTLEIATLEQLAGITPSANSYHYNIVAETAFTGYVQQFLNNQNAKVIADMTASCAMAP
ncbi:MAG: trypsin-like serine protease [Rhodospirillaceae bacterium]|nr:trypsin-like serine protease [Rhodospirillaceae bacterium]